MELEVEWDISFKGGCYLKEEVKQMGKKKCIALLLLALSAGGLAGAADPHYSYNDVEGNPGWTVPSDGEVRYSSPENISTNGGVAVGAGAGIAWSTGRYQEEIDPASAAYGAYSKAENGATALGGYSQATAVNSVAVGAHSRATGENSVAVGYNAAANNSNSVVLGTDSTDSGTAAGTVSSGSYRTADNRTVSYGHFAGENASGVVSVGSETAKRRVTNVAAGQIAEESTDAVNGSQIYSLSNSLAQQITSDDGKIMRLSGRVDRLSGRINKVGAGAAALAALHPMDFDPDSKWDFAVGYGNYRNAGAVAVGAFYRPNEDTMLSVGGAFGNGENMMNAGVSLKIGSGNHVSTSRVALAKEVKELRAMVMRLEAENQKILASRLQGPAETRDINFPDLPKDHWAYNYVKYLADRGLLEGYPDGEFKGDRTMTRYEFAAIIYRALQNGAPVDGNMTRAMDEFGPEIEKTAAADRIRVDRISGGDNDRHKVERVRVNDEDDAAGQVYRDVYGGYISKQ